MIFSVAIAVSLQLNGLAAPLGLKYGLISNALHTWAVRFDGENGVEISKGFWFDAKDPSVLQVSDFDPVQARSILV